MTVTGTNFKSGVIVRFGTLPGTVTSMTATSLVVRTPAQAEGVVSLTVLNTDGNGVQLPQAFTYRAPAPVVSSLSPVKGPASGNTDVTINGSNFKPGVSVSVDALQATILSVTATRIVVRMPAHAPAVVGLTVTNPDSQQVSKPSAYTYVSGGPAITQVLPGSGPMAGGNTIAILGSGFANATVVIGGVSAAVLTRAADMLTVRVPAHGAGVVAVLVRNSDSLSVTAPDAYTYEDPNAPFTRFFAEGASGSFFRTRFAAGQPARRRRPGDGDVHRHDRHTDDDGDDGGCAVAGDDRREQSSAARERGVRDEVRGAACPRYRAHDDLGRGRADLWRTQRHRHCCAADVVAPGRGGDDRGLQHLLPVAEPDHDAWPTSRCSTCCRPANASSGSTRLRRCHAPTSGSTRTRLNWPRRRCRRRSRR